MDAKAQRARTYSLISFGMWAELGYDKAGIVRNHHIYGECDTTTGYCRLDSEIDIDVFNYIIQIRQG